MSYSLFMNNMKLLKFASLDAQTADAPAANRTAHHPVHREREGEVGKLYFATYTSDSVPYFLPLVGCLSVCITRRGSDSATHGRPVPTPWLICSSLSSDYTL